MTEFEQYFTGLLDGKIVACEKMKCYEKPYNHTEFQ